MGQVIDYKPKNNAVVDTKPNNELVLDWKPKNKIIILDTTDQLYEMTLGRGMLIGLGPYITYSNDIDILSPKSP